MKITIIGGGSYCWTPRLFRDIICTEGLEGSEIVLEDINKRHLEDLHRCCNAILEQLGKKHRFKLSATGEVSKALHAANYVILTISTGGYDAMENDLNIPAKYGIWQPVGDTVGPGGLSRALRNIPVVVGLAKAMEKHCPNAWLLNITNPMSTLTRCVWRETDIRCVGLCHEVYGTMGKMEKLLGCTDWRKELDFVSIGVNHLPWIIKLRHNGQDVFPVLRKALADGKVPSTAKGPDRVMDKAVLRSNQVKFELFKVFNALPAAEDRHIVEFFPYFCTEKTRKGSSMGVKLTTIKTRRNHYTPTWKRNVADITCGRTTLDAKVSQESTSRVIAGLAGLAEWKDIVNIPNLGQAPDIVGDAVIETMGLIVRDNVYGLPVGPVPPAVLTQIQRHVTNNEIIVEAALTGDRSLVLQAMLNDPLCGAIRDFRQMEGMMNELIVANKKWLPQFFGK